MKMNRKRAFTTVELLMVLIIVSIISSSVFSALSSFFSNQQQTEDYAVGRTEIEAAFSALSSPFANIGLGMPNNLNGEGSFALAFAPGETAGAPAASVMTHMGANGAAWGGPVTVARGDLIGGGSAAQVTTPDADGFYCGSELYYVWSAPLGQLISPDFSSDGRPVQMDPPASATYGGFAHFDDVSKDIGFWCGQDLGLKDVAGGRLKVEAGQWVTIPSFGFPMWAPTAQAGNTLKVTVAPGARARRVLYGGTINGMEELHVVRAARLRVVNGNLVQERYFDPPQNAPSTINGETQRILARNVTAVWFRFNPKSRMLSMSVAARGIYTNTSTATPARPAGWPDGAPDVGDGKHRIMVESRTWRIRN